MHYKPQISTYQRFARNLLVTLMLCVSPLVGAADDENKQVNETAAAAEKQEEAKCFHGCQRWGKMCNVDPRGVYKCRRTCERFGEICE